MKNQKELRKEKIEAINKVVEAFLDEYFNLEWNWDLRHNGRIKNSLARFCRRSETTYIEIGTHLLDYGYLDGVIDSMIHECVHYALYSLKVPHSDKKTTFEYTLQFFGVSSNYNFGDRTDKTIVRYKAPFNKWYCANCGKESIDGINFKQETPKSNWFCGKCFREYKEYNKLDFKGIKFENRTSYRVARTGKEDVIAKYRPMLEKYYKNEEENV